MDTILSMVNVSGFWLNKSGKEKLKLRLRKAGGGNNELKNKMKISEICENESSYLEDGILDLEFDALDLYENCNELVNVN